jgi:hypothetical protein
MKTGSAKPESLWGHSPPPGRTALSDRADGGGR